MNKYIFININYFVAFNKMGVAMYSVCFEFDDQGTTDSSTFDFTLMRCKCGHVLGSVQKDMYKMFCIYTVLFSNDKPPF